MDKQRAEILLVEDDRSLQDVLTEHLSGKYRVQLASSAKEALQSMESNSFDLIVLDLHLPDGSGIDLMQHSLSDVSDPPFIAMTSHPDVDVAVNAMKVGAVDYIVKPFELGDFDRVVERALQTSGKREKIQKRQITLRLDVSVIDYFKRLASETGITYQNLINLYLRGCVQKGERLNFEWKTGKGSQVP